MALQDLTPQLRTRLNRLEWAVGWFVLFATALLLFGFGYYVYKTAERKGWFKVKAKFYIFTDTAKGLNVGDPIEFRGSQAGSITDIQPMPARGKGSEYNIYVEFEVAEPNIGYLWSVGSDAKVTSADISLAAKRVIEVTRGTNGYSIYIQRPVRQATLSQFANTTNFENLHLGEELRNGSNVVERAWRPLTAEIVKQLSEAGRTNVWLIDTSGTQGRSLTAMWNQGEHHYEPITKSSKYGLPTAEDPALSDRLQELVSKVEGALPGVLALTNQISAVLANSANLTSNLNAAAQDARPVVSNLTLITARLKDQQAELDELLRNANVTLTNADTNLVALAESLGRTLDNVANITSNLNQQVQTNSSMLKEISDIIVHTDEFVQGLKRHWLLRSAFRTPQTNAPSAGPGQPFKPPKAQSTGH